MYILSSLAFPCYMNARGSRKQHDCHALSTSHRRCLHSSEALGSLPPCRISKANRLYEGFGACPCTARRFQARRYLCKSWFRTMHCCSEAYALARLSSGKSCVLIVMNIDRIHYPLVPRVIATCSSTDRDQTLRNDEVGDVQSIFRPFHPTP